MNRTIFVECFNTPPIEEAKWALKLADSADSMIVGVVAHIPVFQGRIAVEEFLA